MTDAQVARRLRRARPGRLGRRPARRRARPRSASAASRCRRGSGSWSPSPAPTSPTPTCWCSTRRPAPSTRPPSSGSPGRWTPSPTGRTTLTIAHRLSTAERADEVLVVDAGRVVQRGSARRAGRRRGPLRPAARLVAPVVGRGAGARRRLSRRRGTLVAPARPRTWSRPCRRRCSPPVRAATRRPPRPLRPCSPVAAAGARLRWPPRGRGRRRCLVGGLVTVAWLLGRRGRLAALSLAACSASASRCRASCSAVRRGWSPCLASLPSCCSPGARLVVLFGAAGADGRRGGGRAAARAPVLRAWSRPLRLPGPGAASRAGGAPRRRS